MPKLPKQTVDLVFFLYRTEADARAGTDIGGTGFFVAVPSEAMPEAPHLFAVTNWHVAVKGGSSVLRLNNRSGGVEIFEYGPEDWIFSKGSHDLAVLPFDNPLDRKPLGLNLVCVSSATFLTDKRIAELELGPGDNVFMPGRFVDIGGLATNIPALRFGNISMMPQPIRQTNGASPASYCIDMHSRDGFSGSPVFAYRTIGQDLENLGSIDPSECFMEFLGVHWGQFPEYWEIKRGQKASERGEISLEANADYIEGRSGMTCVAPASALAELLAHPKITIWLAEQETARVAWRVAHPTAEPELA